LRTPFYFQVLSHSSSGVVLLGFISKALYTMSTNSFAVATAGAIFGAALTAAGVVSPSTIIAQMELADLRMLKVFVTATGTSA
jgi:hypothetical protein